MADHGQAGTPRPWPLHALSWEQPWSVSISAARPCPAPARPSPGFILETGLCAVGPCV